MSSKPWHVFKRFMLLIGIWLILWCAAGFVIGSSSGGCHWQIVPILFSLAGIIAGFTYSLITHLLAPPPTATARIRKKKILPTCLKFSFIGATSTLSVYPFIILSNTSTDVRVFLFLLLMGATTGVISAFLS